jgi:hypothetical protein
MRAAEAGRDVVDDAARPGARTLLCSHMVQHTTSTRAGFERPHWHASRQPRIDAPAAFDPGHEGRWWIPDDRHHRRSARDARGANGHPAETRTRGAR